MDNYPLILASESPRRKELLEMAGIAFIVRPSQVDETLNRGESPAEYVLRLSSDKAVWCARRRPEAWVLAADTVVVLEDRIMGKPRDRAEAGNMLESLSGRTHQVLTGYCLLNRKLREQKRDYVLTHVEFRTLARTDIDAYLDSGEPLDKAGAYAIQGLGAALVKRINGSYTNVVGLPLVEIMDALRQYKLIP